MKVPSTFSTFNTNASFAFHTSLVFYEGKRERERERERERVRERERERERQKYRKRRKEAIDFVQNFFASLTL